MSSADDYLYKIDIRALRGVIKVRQLFMRLAEDNNEGEVARLVYCLQEGKTSGVVAIPPVPSAIWNCMVEPCPYSARPVLTHKYATAIDREGLVTYNRLVLDRGPLSGELFCVHMRGETTTLNELMESQRHGDDFAVSALKLALGSPRLLNR